MMFFIAGILCGGVVTVLALLLAGAWKDRE